MKFFLIVAKGSKQGMPIPIDKVDLFLIGSDKVCQLRPKSDQIGTQHCALLTRERKVFVRDLDSGHNTLVNYELLPPGEEWPLHAGDRLSIGPLEFIIQFTEKPLSQRDLEEWALKCLDNDEGTKKPAVDMDGAAAPGAAMLGAANAAAAMLDQLSAMRGVVKGRLRISRENGVIAVRINDVNLVEEAELKLINKELHDHLGVPNQRVLVDFKNVRRMSSTAAELFRDLANWLRPFGSTLAFCRMRPDLRDTILAFPGLERISVFDDKAEALANRW